MSQPNEVPIKTVDMSFEGIGVFTGIEVRDLSVLDTK